MTEPQGRYEKVKMAGIMWLAARLPSCSEICEMASQSLERDLSLRERIQMRMHFLICVWCTRYANQLHFMRDTVRTFRDEVQQNGSMPDGGLSEETKERMRRLLAGGE